MASLILNQGSQSLSHNWEEERGLSAGIERARGSKGSYKFLVCQSVKFSLCVAISEVIVRAPSWGLFDLATHNFPIYRKALQWVDWSS